MKITGKTKTAIKALIVLGLHDDRLSVREIAEKESLPVRYLEQLIASLKKAKLVNSLKGPSGGYTLAKSAESISVLNIIVATDGLNTFAETCDDLMSMVINDEVMKPLDDSMVKQLEAISLKHLIDAFKTKSSQEYMYYI